MKFVHKLISLLLCCFMTFSVCSCTVEEVYNSLSENDTSTSISGGGSSVEKDDEMDNNGGSGTNDNETDNNGGSGTNDNETGNKLPVETAKQMLCCFV